MVFFATLLGATLRVSTPILLAAIGETYSERSGVLNLGIEGIMLFGAFSGFYFAEMSGSLWFGLLAAIISGMLFGLLMALLTVTFGLNQHVSGLGLTLFCEGLAFFFFRLLYGGAHTPPSIDPFRQIKLFEGNPILEPIFGQYLLTYLTFLVIIPLMWWILYKTRFGLHLRAAGENPEAVDAAGVNVFGVRYASIIIGGGFMAAGGAFLSLCALGSFTHGMVNGRGWVALAIVIFGNWNPVKAMWGALIFGGAEALQLRLQAMGLELPVPYETFLALPYVLTIIALVLAGRNASYPAALLKPYKRE